MHIYTYIYIYIYIYIYALNKTCIATLLKASAVNRAIWAFNKNSNNWPLHCVSWNNSINSSDGCNLYSFP